VNDNETLTRVGPGTPMGALMRQYWIPALMSSELAPDGPPLRLKLLGEELLAFRTTAGKVGIMDHRCPHRCASLFYGRNEEDGIRCVFHGWKFDAEGRCVDQPNLRPERMFKEQVRTRAYPTTERGGVIWTYMGPRKTPPPLPNFPVLRLPSATLSVWCEQRECNYLQCVEGEIDTSHAGFLHLGAVRPEDVRGPQGLVYDVINRTIEYKVAETDGGVLAGGYRDIGGGKIYWRFANFLLPFWTQPPPCPFGTEAVARAWVPMDDTHTMLFSISTSSFLMARGPKAPRPPVPLTGLTFDYEFLPNTTNWYGRWRLKADVRNDHLIDRKTQLAGSYSGIEGLDVQDTAVQESMGPIVDRSMEHLAPSDLAVARSRRRLLKAVKALRDKNAIPPGVDQPDAYDTWSGYVTAPEEQDWREVYAANLPKSARAHA
jgi:nitrite reductase/ring-hydroxylating ferredoxin subunit